MTNTSFFVWYSCYYVGSNNKNPPAKQPGVTNTKTKLDLT